MKKAGWAGAVVLAAMFGCGGSKSGGSGSGGSGGTDYALTINVAGGGTVTMAAQSVSCTSVCTESLASGTAVHLDAAPASGMQFNGWSGACSGNGGCDLTMTADTQVGATFAAAAPSQVSVTVNLVGTGSGRVTSMPAGIDCPGICSMSVPVGTGVTLSASAAQNSMFSGYGFGCSGNSCGFTASVSTTIYANFTSTVVTPAMHTLTVAVTGSGTITSTPAGISCPGKCSAQFAEGSNIGLTETPASGVTFSSWSGACSGNAGCTVTLAADTSVGAAFAADPCAGLLPKLATATTFTATHSDASDLSCSAATTDGAGNLFVSGDYTLDDDTTHTSWRGIFTSAGDVNDTPAEQSVDVGPVPLTEGFGLLKTTQSSYWLSYDGYNPNGSNETGYTFPISNSVSAWSYDVTGGSVLVTCADDSPHQGPASYVIDRFNGSAVKTSEVTLNESGTVGCLWVAAVMVDAKNDTLLVVRDNSSNLQARWLDADGNLLTADWFQVGTAATDLVPVVLRPLIGGGAAMRVSGAWTGVIPSGQAQFTAAPAYLEAGKDVQIVEGGQAYAMIPDANTAGTLDVVAPGGQMCGSLVTAAATDTLSVGRDGTLIDLNACSATYWAEVLK